MEFRKASLCGMSVAQHTHTCAWTCPCPCPCTYHPPCARAHRDPPAARSPHAGAAGQMERLCIFLWSTRLEMGHVHSQKYGGYGWPVTEPALQCRRRQASPFAVFELLERRLSLLFVAPHAEALGSKAEIPWLTIAAGQHKTHARTPTRSRAVIHHYLSKAPCSRSIAPSVRAQRWRSSDAIVQLPKAVGHEAECKPAGSDATGECSEDEEA